MNKVEIFFLILATCVMGIAMGMVVHIYENSKSESEIVKDAYTLNSLKMTNETKTTSSNEEKVSPNAIIEIETYYKKCGHTVISKQNVSKEDINKTKQEIEEKYSQYKLKSFSSNMIKLYQQIDKICDNHYVVKDENGTIAVFSINSDGTETLKNETEYSTKYLPDEDINLLKKGIEANSNEELQDILSDFE